MNKIQVPANYWFKILEHYRNVLNEKFLYQPLTPVTQHHMQQTFAIAVREARNKETHPAWHVPLTLSFDLTNHHAVIEPTNPDQLDLT
jgi:hypothetical protein